MHATTFLLAAAVVINGQASSPSERIPGYVPHCIISLIDHADMPAEESGILTSLTAKEGQEVKKGEVLGKIDDRDALAREKAAGAKLAAATKKAVSENELKVARKIIELAVAEYNESVEINKRSPDSIPEATVRRQRVQWEKAVLDEAVAVDNHIIAGHDKTVAEAEAQAVQYEVDRRTLRAPFDGVIVQLYRQESEWVQPGEPILRIVNMDSLRVEGFLSAEDYAPDQVKGASVTITVDLAGDDEAKINSTISYVSPVVEASGDYRIWAEVEKNPPGRGEYPWLLRPGSEAEMQIHLKGAASSSTR